MLEVYYKYKVDYKDYLIIIKSGIFYECISKDALIINKLFDYKIKKISNTFKVGFSIKNRLSVIERLEEENINYIVIDDNNIEKKHKCENNNYSKYNFDIDLILYNFIEVDKIIKYLSDNILEESISKKINKISKILEE